MQATLDRFAADPVFVRVQDSWRQRYPAEFHRFESTFIDLLRARGPRGATAEEVTELLPRPSCCSERRCKIHRYLPGIVTGYLRSSKVISVISREKSIHREAKSRWVNRFILNPQYSGPASLPPQAKIP